MNSSDRFAIRNRLFAALAFVLFSAPAFAANVHWVGASGNWSTASNWGGGSVPGSSDKAIIDANGTYTVTLDVVPSYNTLTIGGATSGTQTLKLAVALPSKGATVDSGGVLDTNGNNVTGAVTVKSGGKYTWAGGTASAKLTVNSGGTLEVTTAGANLNGVELANSGTVNLTGGGIVGQGNATVTNSGTLSIQGDYSITTDSSGNFAIANSGTLQKTSGTGTSSLKASGSGTASNDGTLNAQTGTIRFDSAASGGGTFTASSGAAITMPTATNAFSSGVTFSGAGQKTISADSNFAGTVNLSGTTTALDGGSYTFAGVSLAGTGTLEWKSGTFATTGSGLTVNATLKLTTSGTHSLNGAILKNSGTLQLSGASLGAHNAATINNQSSGTVLLEGDYGIAPDGSGNVTITNAGLLRKTAGSGTSTIQSVGSVITNSGTIDAQSGTIQLASGVSNGTSAVVNAASGAAVILSGSGNIFANNSQFTGTGTKTISGDSSFGGTFTATATTLDGATFTFSAPGTIDGTVEWKSGTITGSGVTVKSGSTFNITTSGTHLVDGDAVTNSGTVNVTSASVTFTNNASFMNNASATLAFSGDSGFAAGATLTAPVLTNKGTLSKGGVAGTATIGVSLLNIMGATTQSTVGTLDLAGGVTTSATSPSHGAFTSSTGATIRFSSDATLDIYTALSGGNFVFSGGTVAVHGSYSAAATTVSGGANTLDGTITGVGALTISGGTLTLNGTTASVAITTLAFSGGTLAGTVPVNYSGTSGTWSGGTLTNTGGFTTTSSSVLAVSGDVYVGSGGIFNNNGTTTLASSARILSAGGSTGGTVNNGGTLNLGDGSKLDVSSTPAYALNNSGTIAKNSGTGTATIGVALTNKSGGAVQATSGILDLTGGVAATATSGTPASFGAAGGTIRFSSDASLDAYTAIAGGNVVFASGTSTAHGSYSALSTTVSGASATLDGTITALGALTISSGTLTLNGATSGVSVSSFTFSGGTLAGTVPVSFTGTSMPWSGGTLTNGGGLTISATSTLAISADVSIGSGGKLANNGSATLASAKKILSAGGATGGSITNAGTFDLADGSSLDGTITPAYTFTNSGTLRKSSGAGTATVAVALTNQPGGAVRVLSGTFDLAGGVTATGTGASNGQFSASTGATLSFSGNASLDTNTTLTGGTIDFRAGTIAIHGGYDAAEATKIGTGTPSVTIDGAITDVGALTLSGGTLTLNGATSFIAPTSMTFSGGTLAGTVAVAVTSSTLTWSGGTLTNTGGIGTSASTTTAVSGTVAINGGKFNNAGTMAFAGGAHLQSVDSPAAASSSSRVRSDFAVAPAGSLNNSGTIELNDGVSITNTLSPGYTINNTGTIKKASGSGTASIDVSLTNASAGKIAPTSGTISFPSGFTQQGTLSFDIASATGFGKLDIGAAFTLGGTLAAAPVGGYVPPSGTAFDVITFASAPSGSFATKSLSYSRGQFNDTIASNKLTLTAAAPPCLTPATGVVSWWPAEGNPFDVVGSNQGKFAGGATTASGLHGSAFSLDGTAAYVTVPDSSTLRQSAFTIEGWVNFGAVGATPQTFFAKGVGSYDSFVVGYDGTMLRASVGNASGRGAQLTSAWTPVAGTWYHVALTLDGTGNETLYLDGTAVATAPAGLTMAFDANPFTIGADYTGSATAFFKGLVDEVTLYDHALTATEIKAISNAWVSGKCSTPPAAPTITTLVPAAAPVGASVVINGTNLTTTNTVLVNGAAASFGVTNDTKVTAVVPAGATETGDISLTTAGGTANKAFRVCILTASISASGSTRFCEGNSVTLTAQATGVVGTLSYQWYFGTAPVATTSSLVVTQAGNYTVVITDAGSTCSATSAATTVTVDPKPVVAISGPTAACSGSQVTLDAGAQPLNSQYLWSTGATTRTITFNASTTATFTVTVTSSRGCSDSASTTVTVTAATPPVISTAASICAGGSGTASVTAVGGASYTWTITNGTLTAGQGTNVINFTAGAAGSVDLSAIVSGTSCANGTANANVAITPAADATITTGSTVCIGGSGTASVPQQNGATYVWTISGGSITSGAGTSSVVFSPGSGTTVTLGVTVTSGSCSASSSQNIAIVASNAPQIIAPASICPSGSGNASVASANGATYVWSITNGTITGGDGTSTIAFKAGASGTVAITVTVSGSTCGNGTTTANVPIDRGPAVVISGPTAICAGGTVTLDAGAGFSSYHWSTGADTRAITVKPDATTTYRVSVTSGGCVGSAAKTVTVRNPSAAITAPGSTCAGSPTSAGAMTQEGATYNWTISGGSINGSSGAPYISFTPAAGADSVTLSLTVAMGSCSATESKVIPVVSGQPIAISGPSAVCPNTPFVLDAGAGYSSYLWSTGAQTQTISVTQTDASVTYTVTATSGGSCSATGSKTVTLVSPADAAIFAASQVNAEETATAFVTPVDGATYDWSASTGVTFVGDASGARVSFRAASTGTATLRVTMTVAGCSASGSKSITVVAATTCNTTAPAPTSPASGASKLSSPVTLGWTAVTGAAQYTVSVFTTTGARQFATTTASTSVTVSLPSGGYEWSVAAVGTTGCPDVASEPRSFSVGAAVSCPPAAGPQVSGPGAGASVSSPVTFGWTAVAGATGYRVWVIRPGLPRQDLGMTTGTSRRTTIAPGTASWFVEALFDGCDPAASAVVPFTVLGGDACAGHAPAGPVAPASGLTSSSSRIEFRWTEAPLASGYRVWASVNGRPAVVYGATTTALSLRAVLPAGHISWHVEALFDGCSSVNSDEREFDITPKQNCPSAAPVLVSPTQGATVDKGNVAFSWSAADKALSYELWMSLDGGTPTYMGTTTATSMGRVVPPGALQWMVRVNFDGCPSIDSPMRNLTYTPPAQCAGDPPVASVPIDGASTTMSEPMIFSWSAVPGASSYLVDFGDGTTAEVTGTSTMHTYGDTGDYNWSVAAVMSGCEPAGSTPRLLHVEAPGGCVVAPSPVLVAPGQVTSGVPYTISWTTPAANLTYELQEWTAADGSDAVSIATSSDHVLRTHTVSGTQPVVYRYRVRAFATCADLPPSDYSQPLFVAVLPAKASSSGIVTSVPVSGGRTLTYTLPIAASFAGQHFTATPTTSWLTVTPSSGVVPAGGIDLTVVADTSHLPLGTSIGGVTIAFTAAASSSVRVDGTTPPPTPITVNVVQPTMLQPKSTPPPDALIIPGVAHAGGVGSQFQSDVRLSNTSAQTIKYQLTFTPSGENGLASGKQTTVDVSPGKTIALDDVLASWFGGSLGAIGTLEIRPLTQTSTSSSPLSGQNLLSFASSRTFAVTDNGTFGQYVPAIPFASFIGGASDPSKASILSLQQIVQSDAFRTNLGFVEGAGQPAQLLVSIFGDDGTKLKDFNISLAAGQHMQMNSFLTSQGIGNLSDGRVEVKVLGSTGRVTAYASVLDNKTNDPLLVTPVQLGGAGASRWVVPGVADLSNGFSKWVTDVRVFNAGSTATDATLTFYSQSGGEPLVQQISLAPHEVKVFDAILANTFGALNQGGALHITTPSDAQLFATARTYNITSSGTYGQFLSAITPADAIGAGSRPLQILQVEESDRYRTNLAIAEVTGKPATVQISVVPPDSRITATVQVNLAAFEYRQLNSILQSVGMPSGYNARVTVRVVEGAGKVTACAAVIDQKTQDPTFIPAQ